MGKCEYCGREADLRPYGRNGANICFKCGMENEEETAANFAKKLDNNEVPHFIRIDMN